MTELITSLQMTVVSALTNIFEGVVLWIPNLLGAILMFLFGLLFAKVVRDIVALFLDTIQLDRWLSKYHVSDVVKEAGITLTISGIIEFIVYWVVLLAFIESAVGLLGIVLITNFITTLLGAVPEVAAAAVILLLGITIAQYAAGATRRFFRSKSFAVGVKSVIIFLTALVAVDQLGIDISIIANIVTNVITAIVFALAIAFGFGGREKAKEFIERYIEVPAKEPKEDKK